MLVRDITRDGAQEITNILCRIAPLVLLGASFDRNYVAVKTNCYPRMASWILRPS